MILISVEEVCLFIRVTWAKGSMWIEYIFLECKSRDTIVECSIVWNIHSAGQLYIELVFESEQTNRQTTDTNGNNTDRSIIHPIFQEIQLKFGMKCR